MEKLVEPKLTARTQSADWEHAVGKLAPRCEGCGRDFAPKDACNSLLEFVDGRPQRRVFCDSCREKVATPPFAWWRSRIAGPESGKPRPLDVGFLVELFQRLHGEAADPAHSEVRYIVTLLLVRKRILQQTGQVTRGEGDEAREFLLTRFVREKDSPEFETPIPDLTPERMEAIRDDLGRIFNL